MTGAAAGRLFGVGVGPGDPELVTVKAQRIIGACDAVAYPEKRAGSSIARRAAAPWISEGCEELALVYPVTTGETDHPEGYEGALRDYYDAGAERIAERLDAGCDVAVLCEGDPFFYGSYMYLHERLAERYATEVVPGVTAFSAAAAAAGTPLAKRDDVLVVAPGTLAPDVLAGHLRDADAAVVMKLGRRFDGVRAALSLAGADVADRGVYVERASCVDERVAALDEAGGDVPYMALVLVPSARTASAPAPARAPAPAAAGERTPASGSLAVVGLGPAGPDWLTPEASAVLADADELVGYGPYLDRVPQRAGQVRHASDNRVELDRARHALRLAAAGATVAVVSSGDPGIFAMATAVLEAVEAGNGQFAEVDLRVVPGLSAMHAAAARVGAPLGHDFAVISLSDQRKPWAIVERRLEAAGAADFALALYNPASKTRREQLERARDVLLRHRSPDTPVVVARDVGGAGEAVSVATLGGFDAATVDMRTLLVVGSSTTRVIAGRAGRELVFTPRDYPA
jgi:precorrin-2 C20-methyltransferase/precorrin-3B C17-methyltransferase